MSLVVNVTLMLLAAPLMTSMCSRLVLTNWLPLAASTATAAGSTVPEAAVVVTVSVVRAMCAPPWLAGRRQNGLPAGRAGHGVDVVAAVRALDVLHVLGHRGLPAAGMAGNGDGVDGGRG